MTEQNSQSTHSFVYSSESAKKKKIGLIELIKPIRFIILVIIIVIIVTFSRSLYFFSVKRNSIKKTQIEKNFQEGKKLLSEGQFELAEKLLKKAVKAKPENINYLQNLAIAKYNLKDYQGAIRNYERIIKINSKDAFSYNGLGNIYRDLGQKEIAKENYKKAIKVDPRFTVAYSNLALLLDEEGKKEEAVKILEEGIKANPESEGLKGVLKILKK